MVRPQTSPPAAPSEAQTPILPLIQVQRRVSTFQHTFLRHGSKIYTLRYGEVELLLLVLELGAEQTEAEARCCKESGEIVHVGDDDADDDDVGDDDE